MCGPLLSTVCQVPKVKDQIWFTDMHIEENYASVVYCILCAVCSLAQDLMKKREILNQLETSVKI